MNPGVFPGAGQGVIVGSISRYIQTPTITTSQTINVPSGTQRIEALLVGGGGGGAYGSAFGSGGGGFGGAAIIEVPITGYSLQVVIGAGGAGGTTDAMKNNGSPTYVISAGVRYAEVGGGGAGINCQSTVYVAGSGRSGGSGGACGGYNLGASPFRAAGGYGGAAPIGKIIWSIYPQIFGNSANETADFIIYASSGNVYQYNGTGPSAGGSYGINAQNGQLGAGGGGGYNSTLPAYGGGGGGFTGAARAGSFGGGAGANGTVAVAGASGGSLTSVSIWGYTGGAGGTSGASSVGNSGGGGGGLFANGNNGAAASIGGAGGLGGGGGGAGGHDGAVGYAGGAGGAGAAVIRFYL